VIHELFLPGRLSPFPGFPNKYGDLWFYPAKSKFINHPLLHTFHDESEITEKTELYANSCAFEHYFLKAFNLDFNDTVVMDDVIGLLIASPYSSAAFKRFVESGIKRSDLVKTIRESHKRKGVVFSLKEELLHDFTPMDGDKGEGDLKINCPDGLPIRFLSGLEPLGQQEWDYFTEHHNRIYRS